MTVWRQSHGHGPRVVVVHGSMDRSSSFGRLQRNLPDWEVVRYDRRGYGRSVDLGPPSSFRQQVDDLLEVVDGRPCTVFGHSYGGTIAVAAAESAPDLVRAVVAYESPMPWTEWWPSNSAGSAAVNESSASGGATGEVGERFMRRLVGDATWERLPPSTKAARRLEGPTLVAELAQIRPPCPPGHHPAQVRVPVIAAHGTQSAPHHVHAASELAAGAPKGELVVVDGAGHGVHLTHPAEAAALVRRAAAAAGVTA